MDHVKVHYNSDQPAQLQAHAYAQGSEIHVAPGQERHVPHEAWHVVQQAQGRVKPTVQLQGGVDVNNDVGLESEADAMGARALQLARPDSNKKISSDPGTVEHTTMTGSTESVTQRLLFAPPNTGDVVRWNAMLQHVQNLHARHVLPNIAVIDNYILQAEGEWEGDGDHAAPTNQFNAVVTLKYRIKEELTALRMDPTAASNLNWGNIVGFLAGVNTGGFITIVRQINVALSGGHGNGDSWTASNGTTGTVPYATHGLGGGALNGARGAVRTVILAHNAAVEAAKTHVDNL